MPITAFQNKSALLFVPNQGQTNEKARFIARVNGHQFYFTQNSIAAVTYARAEGDKTNNKDALLRDPLHKRAPVSDAPLCGAALFLTFEGAAPIEPQGQMRATGRLHYFTGNDPANWRTQLPGYEQLGYQNLYDGVDLTLAGGEGGLKFLWSLKQTGNVGAIRIRYEGAEEIRISENGGLLIRHALGKLVDPAPVAWQEIGGVKKPVACAYALNSNTVSFALTGAYDATAPLMIDPILPYSTYLGGSGADVGYAIAVDSLDCAYVSGTTSSLDFPVTPGAFMPTSSGRDSFVSKFTPDGTGLVFSTYIGGSRYATCLGIAVDESLHAYITGFTDSPDFPVTSGAFQTVFGGTYDAFVTKLSPDGASLVYSTLLGGTDADIGSAIAVDDQDCAYVTGYTQSANFPTTAGAYQTILQGPDNAFVTKLSPEGSSLVYSTYFGKTNITEGAAIAVDGQGCAYIAGYTLAPDLPVTPGAFQPVFGGDVDGFVTKFNATGSSLLYCTYLGGTNADYAYAIAVDNALCAYVSGNTYSANFPVTSGAFQTGFGGVSDAFVTKLSPTGGGMASTFLGGSDLDICSAIALDAQENVYVTGRTYSTDFPITPQVVPSSLQGYCNVLISILSPALDRLLVSEYVGGNVYDVGDGIATGADGALYVTGNANSANFPTTPGAFQTVYAGDTDAFVVKEGFVLLKKASISLQGMP